ncbi:ABC transporter permease [Lactobacillus sp. YT155]|uniref:FtsX-like permease family protein n=1 Tax=Lactobacillus sp. YT155 TaxID=3060955 RepID=UPI0026603F35|nr:FtsX-like permease family protein [Lactobacillus sp. YT155]MDO1605705.1 ABC transporter permease [Lactobacillus sp. YT155]
MFLALKEIKHSKLKFSLLTLIIFLIIFLVMFITGLANGLSNDGKSALSSTDIQSFVLQKNSNKRISRSNLTTNDIAKIKKDHDQLVPLTISQRTVQKSSDKNNKTDISFFAIDAKSFLAPTISEGKKLANDNSNNVIASEKLKKLGYKIGDKFKETTTNQEFKITGFTSESSYSHTPVIYLNNKENQKILTTGINTLVSQKKISKVKGFDVVDINSIIQNIPGYSEEQGSLLMMIGFLFAISVVVLSVFFYIITLEKLPQLGTLKALGTSTRYLGLNLISQAALITIFSLIISDALILIMKMSLPASMPFSLSTTTLLGTNLLFIVISIISSSISLIKISKVDPISAIGGK